MSRRQTTTKVFVGSLPGGVTTDDLRRLFAPYGPIAECDIANRCGFLHLEDKDLAFKAIEELNNTNFMGTRISVEKGRVKPPKSRRGDSGGPMKGGRDGRDRSGPYSRGDSFRGGPPPPRNGSYGRYESGGMGYEGEGGRYGDYDRALPPRDYDTRYDDLGDRRPPYDDRYIADRRSAYNGYDVYDRRPAYPDARPPYGDVPPRGGYDDDRRIPPGPTGYDDRRSLAPPPPAAGGYDRAASGPDMYSRRDTGPKPLIPPSPGYGDRSVAAGYSAVPATPAAYGSPSLNVPSNIPATPTGYGTGPSSYSTPAAGYGAPAPGVYGGDTRGGAASVTAGYGSVPAAGGGYGDSYSTAGGRTAGYDTAYPPLPQQRGYGSGSGPGTGPRRDMSSGRRY